MKNRGDELGEALGFVLGQVPEQTEPGKDTKEPYRIRLSVRDCALLDELAEIEGSSRAALIRKAIKQLLRKEGYIK